MAEQAQSIETAMPLMAMQEQAMREHIPKSVELLNGAFRNGVDVVSHAVDTAADWVSEHVSVPKRAVAVIVVGGLALAGCGSSSNGKTNTTGTTEATANTIMSPQDLQAIKDLMTVSAKDSATVPSCVELVTEAGVHTSPYTDQDGNVHNIYMPIIGAEKTMAQGNISTDAMSTPMTAEKTDPAAMLKEIQTAICEDPLLAGATLKMFANMEVGGVKVIDLNQWLQPWAGDTTNINDEANNFVPPAPVNPGSVTDAEARTAAQDSINWQPIAQNLNELLARFRNDGDQTGMTTFNFHLDGEGVQVGGLPEVALNMDQMNAEHLQLTLIRKPDTCVLVIGFNVGDKRPEGFECVAPGTPPPTENTPGKPGKPGTPGSHPPTTTGHPGTSLNNKNPALDDNNNTGPNNGGGSGGTLGPRGTTSTTEKPPVDHTTTTFNYGNDTTTTGPVGTYGG
jgi:hypothetical protein